MKIAICQSEGLFGFGDFEPIGIRNLGIQFGDYDVDPEIGPARQAAVNEVCLADGYSIID